MLTVVLRPSPLLFVLLAGMHGFAAAILLVLPIPLWFKMAAVAILLASFVFYAWRDALRSVSHAIRAVRLSPECACSVQSGQAEWAEAKLLDSSFVAPYLTVLNLRIAGNRLARHVVILPDAVDPDSFRKLRVLLRWKCGKSEAPPRW
jgi:toxin CptA